MLRCLSNVQKLQQLFGQASLKQFNPYSKAVFTQLQHCHTATLGMHTYKCSDQHCSSFHYQYHSCGSRHCPNCGGLKKEQWIEDLTTDLLPSSYYHVVFTLPHEFNALIMGNRKLLFKLLFDAASQTLLQLAGDDQWLGGRYSITAIMHTWGQDLTFHPHVHCIVSGGGINNNNEWIKAKKKQW